MAEPGATPSVRAAPEADRLAAQKRRNLWLGLILFGFVILVAAVSAIRLAENIASQAGGG